MRFAADTASERHRSIYLNDHLMASTAGLALARRLARENAGTRLGDVLEGIAGEIAEDRAALLELMRDLHVRPSVLKQIVGAAAERVALLKLNGHLLRYSALSRMLELETLSVGIAGKLELWEALLQAAAVDPRVNAARLRQLADRARGQRERLEPWRLAAARQALTRPPEAIAPVTG